MWKTSLRILSGAFFIAASLYCFTSFIPYTYLFLIQTPPYVWISDFAKYAPLLYWAAFVAGGIAFWEERKNFLVAASFLWQAILGLCFTWKHMLLSVHGNQSALAWAVLLLVPTLSLSLRHSLRNRPDADSAGSQDTLLPYSTGVLVALVVAVLSILGLQLYHYRETGSLHMSAHDLQLIPFVVAAHVWLAILLLTVINTIQFFVQRRSLQPRLVRRWMLMVLIAAGLALAIIRFARNTLTMQGWPTALFAVLFSLTLVCWVTAMFIPATAGPHKAVSRWFLYPLCLASGLVGLLGPVMLADGDWNGLLQDVCCLVFWFLLTASIFRLRPQETRYSLPAMAAVLIVAGSAYFGLGESGFLWAQQLGKNDGEVTHSLEGYSVENASFELARKAVSNPSAGPCGDLCRTLRQYTNVKNAQALTPLRLVDSLEPTTAERPNIFIFVVDSLRPDYVGAYNSAVDFTPGLDALAADSVVMKNAFTPYAGTTLAEPAVWTGALMLHAHYQRPFDNLNLLKTLAKTDGYELAVSYDTILRRLIAPDDIDFKMDADKAWKDLDIESTTRELEAFLDSRADHSRPVLFYSQPVDIQELGQARIPPKTKENWRDRPGFNNKIAYQLAHADAALAKFIAYLKARNLYESSIIIVTADHGDALAENGRRGHSYILFPEIMHIPLIVHLPRRLRGRLIWDPNQLASLIDITPTLYYLLGHRPIRSDLVLGRPLFFESTSEMQRYHRDHLLLASDIRAAFGVVTGGARSMYVTYDSPPSSWLFDLVNDPKGVHNIVTDSERDKYNAVIIKDLTSVAAFYGYRPSGGETGVLEWAQPGEVPSGYFARPGTR
jgi:arylsulfatase A-like enzyme